MASTSQSSSKTAQGKRAKIKLPPQSDWRTTDEDEVNRRRQRALDELFRIKADPENAHPVFGSFAITSKSGQTYRTQLRSLSPLLQSCQCADYRTNGLGTCKHLEGLHLWLQRRGHKTAYLNALKEERTAVLIGTHPAANTLRIEQGRQHLPKKFEAFFDEKDVLLPGITPEEAYAELRQSRSRKILLSQDLEPFLEKRNREEERTRLRKEYEDSIRQGDDREDFLFVDLYPYQREGMLHLAFTGRALLADEMGLGKTVQAIAAAALLQKLGKVERVLVVTPASLKTEWQEQIEKFSALQHAAVFGNRRDRKKVYRDDNPPFFLIANYEQIPRDLDLINEELQPDLIILDEAQRIKNWSTQTAQAVKKLASPNAFVLTGTPLENRIDELYSLIEFLDPGLFGPLFRFNRDYYQLNDTGKAIGYKNLRQLHERIQPIFLRRRKSDIADDLPDRSDRHILVTPTEAQQGVIAEHEHQVARLVATAKRRALRKQEHDKLMRELAMVRMSCDTNFILDAEDNSSSKIAELKHLLAELLEEPSNQIIIFSEWERMLKQLRDEILEPNDIEYAWHTGTVPQQKRRPEIIRFKTDPNCRIFLTTDCGGTGLNLQNANIVINCDLPWNPARLEQRIARAWRKHQTRPVSVINLVAKDTLEERMIDTLANKQRLADGVLDGLENLDEMSLGGTARERMMKRLEALTGPIDPATGQPVSSGNTSSETTEQSSPKPPANPLKAFLQRARGILGDSFLACKLVELEATQDRRLLLTVTKQPALWKERLLPDFRECFGENSEESTTSLELIDQQTEEALARLIELGLAQASTGTTTDLTDPESLASLPDEQPGPPPLTAEEIARRDEHLTSARRHLKLAKHLLAGDFEEESRPPLLAAHQSFQQAVAIEERREESVAEELPDKSINIIAEKLTSELEKRFPAK